MSIHGNVWVHQSKPNKDLAIMTLAVGLVSLIVVAFLRPNIETVLGTFLLVTLIALAVFLTHARTTNVEIDLNKSEVRKTAKYFAFTLRKSYPLQEFDKVTLAMRDEPIEDGYRIPRYSVMLSGKSRLLELFSADTVAEGSAIQKELSAFLNLSRN
jgi:hypothetical protein